MNGVTVKVMRVKSLILLLGLLVGLAACTPRQTTEVPKVGTSTEVSSVSFYPREPGLAWSYLPEGEPVTAVPYVLRALGPTLYAGQQVLAFQLTGRGADQVWYRTYALDGVRLHGLRKPGVNIYLNPAWLEWPAEASWRVGLSWEGSSEITISGDDDKVQVRGVLNYRYLVQERRRVQSPAGAFDVWVVTRQISDTVGGLFPATQQVWFTPYVGEVRTPEGLLLTARSFVSK